MPKTDTNIEELVEERLVKLLSVVDPKKIISVDKAGIVYIGGVQQDKVMLQNLKQEAEMLLASDLWKILFSTPNALAQKAMFKDEGILENQLIKGRAMLYLLDTQKNILETLSKIK